MEDPGFGLGALLGLLVGGVITYWASVAHDRRQQRNATYYWLLGATRSLPMLQHANLTATAHAAIYKRLAERHQEIRNTVDEEDKEYLTLNEQRLFDEAKTARDRADELVVEIAKMNHEMLGHIGKARRLFAVDYQFDDAVKEVQRVVEAQLDVDDATLADLKAEKSIPELLRKLQTASASAGRHVDGQIKVPLRRMVELLTPHVPDGLARDFS
jgi:HPt (histidine-containing phosphotransfer) domain-containing protein